MIAFVCMLQCEYVCMCVCQLCASSTSLGQLLLLAHKCIVNRIKVYIERNNMQVELIRFRKKYIDFFHVYEARKFATHAMFTAYSLDDRNWP